MTDKKLMNEHVARETEEPSVGDADFEAARAGAVARLMAAREMSFSELEGLLWEALLLFQRQPFRTAKGLEFTYTIRGNEIFFSRKEKSITRATVDRALEKALELGGIVAGPKKLGCFGASYLYPVFWELSVIRGKTE